MRPRDGDRYRAATAAMVRAVHRPDLELPDWPDTAGAATDAVSCWQTWLAAVWGCAPVRAAIGHASPELARRIPALQGPGPAPERDVRRAVLATARYLRRLRGRPTPFGLFAGVTVASFADRPSVRWGTNHRAVARPDAGWLATLTAGLLRDPRLLPGLTVMANSSLRRCGERIVIAHRPAEGDASASGPASMHHTVDVSVRHTRAVGTALRAAHTPARLGDVADAVMAVAADVDRSRVMGLLAELVSCRALVTSLTAPSVEPDALAHLMGELAEAGAADTPLARDLAGIAALLDRHGSAPADQSGPIRAAAAARMRRLAEAGARHPVAVDLRLDADLVLPASVARDAERAALLLARLSPASRGTRAWKDYHRRFYQRYGPGALVPLAELVSGSGLGWPDGYLGAPAAGPPQRQPRDEVLLGLAQTAALDGRREIVLDEALISRLGAAVSQLRLPPHLEVALRVAAPSLPALSAGRYRVSVASVSRAAGVLTGRFLPVLDADGRTRMSAWLADLPTGAPDTVRAQLSFPPLHDSSAHVTRTPRVLPHVVSLAECQDTTGADVLTVADLAVGCDSDRLYLAAPALGARVEAWALHALNLHTHTPPLARLITELSRAQYTHVDDVDWGAASGLEFLPRLRSGRIVLSPARWILHADQVPAGHAQWRDRLAVWRERRHVPARVLLCSGDWRLPLHLDQAGDQVLLREHLHTHPRAVLVEDLSDDGWCDHRSHEIVIGVAAANPAGWPRLPRPSRHRVTRHGQAQSPGASALLMAHLYADSPHHDTLLAEHLPALLECWQEPPPWWFLRYRDEAGDCLRLRIVLPDRSPGSLADAAGRVSCWADRLRGLGLVRDLSYPTSRPQSGRWGAGPALAAAHAVFTADSTAVLTQLGHRDRPGHRPLIAAQFLAIAAAFTGSPTAGARWLLTHAHAGAPAAVPRPVFRDAVRLGDPAGDFAALRATPAGAHIAQAWKDRSVALAAYRERLPERPDTGDRHTAGIDTHAVLDALLHCHYLRAVGIDPTQKAVCLYLARAAAHAFLARTGGHP